MPVHLVRARRRYACSMFQVRSVFLRLAFNVHFSFCKRVLQGSKNMIIILNDHDASTAATDVLRRRGYFWSYRSLFTKYRFPVA